MTRLWRKMAPARPPPWWGRVGLALGMTAVATVVRYALRAELGDTAVPFITYFPLILLATLWGGAICGVMTIAASAVAAWWFFVAPFAHDPVAHRIGAWQMVAFFVAAAVIWSAAAALRRAIAELRAREADLEAEIAHRVRAAEQLATVTAELEHRVRNLFTLVIALVQQSARGAGSVAAYRDALMTRLNALSTSLAMITGAQGEPIPIRQLVQSILSAFADGGRLRLHGDDEVIGPDATLSLALILHELATNATKYGALSNDTGSIDIAWSGDGAARRIDWKEHGGPPVSPPTKAGFGARLLAAEGLAARASLAYEPDGLRCEVLLPEDQPARAA